MLRAQGLLDALSGDKADSSAEHRGLCTVVLAMHRGQVAAALHDFGTAEELLLKAARSSRVTEDYTLALAEVYMKQVQ